MKTARIGRILTARQRRAHISRCTTLADGRRHRSLLGDIATCNSNRMHNPATGHHEFAAATPPWVIAIARRRGWITTAGSIPWE